MSTTAKSRARKTRSTSPKKPPAPAIDRDKLRTALRRLGDEYVFYMLDDAIDLLPPAKLEQIARRYLHMKQLRPDRPPEAGSAGEETVVVDSSGGYRPPSTRSDNWA